MGLKAQKTFQRSLESFNSVETNSMAKKKLLKGIMRSQTQNVVFIER